MGVQCSALTKTPLGFLSSPRANPSFSSYLKRCAGMSYVVPNASIPFRFRRTSTAKLMQSELPDVLFLNSSSGSPRKSCIAVRMSFFTSRDKNRRASNRFDLPLAFGPTMAVRGFRLSPKFSKLLKPSISIRVSMTRECSGLSVCQALFSDSWSSTICNFQHNRPLLSVGQLVTLLTHPTPPYTATVVASYSNSQS